MRKRYGGEIIMTIRNNGQKRDPKRLLSALFLLFVAVICFILTFKNGFRLSWLVISLAVLYLAFAMFKSSNEV